MNDVVEVLFPATIAFHWIEPELQLRNVGTAELLADDFIDTALYGFRGTLDFLVQ